MKKKILIIALLSVAVIAVVTTVCLILFKEDEVLVPDYAPPAAEDNAEDSEDTGDDKLEVSQGGGAVALNYTTDVKVDLSDKKVSLFFENPGKSHNNLIIRLVVQGKVVKQSNTILPGKVVRTLDLSDEEAQKLDAGVYSTDTRLEVVFYDPETNERAFTSVEIPVTVNVQE